MSRKKKRSKEYGCEGKQRHATKTEAVAHLISLERSCGYRGHAYRCQFCGFFHVGRRHVHKRA